MYNNPYYMQNYAQNYGQNNQNYMQQPTYNQMPQQNVVQNLQQPTQQVQQRGLPGKVVESLDVIKSIEIPLDGSVSYFVLADGSGIVTKQLTSNGTSKITIFKPISEEKEEIKPITLEDIKMSIDGLNISELGAIKKSVENLASSVEDLNKQIKDFKKKGDK